MSQEDKEGIDLCDPELVAKLEAAVFGNLDLPAKAWLGCLALLLVAKQDTNESIEMDVNGIRVEMSLLPPADDCPLEVEVADEEEVV
jgi:hypothetical protein